MPVAWARATEAPTTGKLTVSGGASWSGRAHGEQQPASIHAGDGSGGPRCSPGAARRVRRGPAVGRTKGPAAAAAPTADLCSSHNTATTVREKLILWRRGIDSGCRARRFLP